MILRLGKRIMTFVATMWVASVGVDWVGDTPANDQSLV